MSAPSKAALRAAEALTTGTARTNPKTLIYCCAGDGWTTAEMAEVIERETGVGELIEALRVVVHQVAEGGSFEAGRTAAAAIAKWEAR